MLSLQTSANEMLRAVSPLCGLGTRWSHWLGIGAIGLVGSKEALQPPPLHKRGRPPPPSPHDSTEGLVSALSPQTSENEMLRAVPPLFSALSPIFKTL